MTVVFQDELGFLEYQEVESLTADNGKYALYFPDGTKEVVAAQLLSIDQ